MDELSLGLAVCALTGSAVLAWALNLVSSRCDTKTLMEKAVPVYELPVPHFVSVEQIMKLPSRYHVPPRVEEPMTEESNMASVPELLARIDERTKAAATLVEQKDIFLRGEMEKVSRAIQALPGEIDAKLKGYATTEALNAVSKRLEGVEGNNKTVGMAVILAFITAIGAVVFKGVG